VRAHRRLQAFRQRLDPGQQPGLSRGGGQLIVARARLGQAEVGVDGGVEDMRVLQAAADEAAYVVGFVGGEVAAV